MGYGIAVLIFIFGGIIVNTVWLIAGMKIGILLLSLLIIITSAIIIKTVVNSIKTTDNKWKKQMAKQKESAEFETIYKYIKTNYTIELEKLRRKLAIRCVIAGILLIVSLIAEGIIAYKTEMPALGVIGIALAITYATYGWAKYNKEYQNKYKKSVIKNFIQTMNSSLKYENIENAKLYQYYQDAQFQNIYYNNFKSNDYISGYIDTAFIEISDVLLKKKTSEKEGDTVYTCVFSYSKINKSIPKEIRIRNDRKSKPIQENRVELDSDEFEKYFDVFCDSQILAMEVLTHDIMEDMIQMYNNCGVNFEVVIKENKIYIRYEVGDIFEGRVFKKSTNEKSLWICYNTLKFAINLTSKVNKVLEEKDV